MSSATQSDGLAGVTDDSQHCRENFWGDGDTDDEEDAKETPEADHEEAAEYIAFQQLQALVQPICNAHRSAPPWNGGRMAELMAWLIDDECIDGNELAMHRENRTVELTDPEVYLPKETDRGTRIIEYRQYKHRRRYNPETGYINWGESTSTGLPEIDYDTFSMAFDTYLCQRFSDKKLRLTDVQEYLEVADRFWHSPDLNSHESLTKAIAHVRQCEDEHAR